MTSRPLFASTPSQQALALAVLRIFAGVTFMMHGYQKLFTFGIAGVQGAFAAMGAPLPTVTGPLIGILEFFGGIALIAGLLTRVVALGLAANMIGAIVLVKLAGGFFAPKGYEYEMMLMAVALTLAIGGAGSASVDGALARRRS